MKPKSCAPEQDDLLRPRLTDMIDVCHELVKPAALKDWKFFETEWGAGSSRRTPGAQRCEIWLQGVRGVMFSAD